LIVGNLTRQQKRSAILLTMIAKGLINERVRQNGEGCAKTGQNVLLHSALQRKISI
jgi:hypothetical protein